jgi:putative membrane protein
MGATTMNYAGDPRNFWREVFTLQGAATPRVIAEVLIFGWIATMIYIVQKLTPDLDISVEVGPHEVAGALLGMLLVLRDNAGYDRWWEARKLWGGIINQGRNLVTAALAYGPADPGWRRLIVCWTAAFAHGARARLRRETNIPDLGPLLGPEQAARARASGNVPTFISLRLAGMLHEARASGQMDDFGFLEAERQRATLIDHLGGCERIRNTPLAAVYSISTRRFIFLFLVTLPFALLHKLKADWLTPLATALVAYLMLTLDHMGVELQEPFSEGSLSHLPLDVYCRNLERDLFVLLEQANSAEPAALPAKSEAYVRNPDGPQMHTEERGSKPHS